MPKQVERQLADIPWVTVLVTLSDIDEHFAQSLRDQAGDSWLTGVTSIDAESRLMRIHFDQQLGLNEQEQILRKVEFALWLHLLDTSS